jgi:hypothetical protein
MTGSFADNRKHKVSVSAGGASVGLIEGVDCLTLMFGDVKPSSSSKPEEIVPIRSFGELLQQSKPLSFPEP